MKNLKITLCGSARFENLFKFWNEALTLSGHTVHTLSVYPSDKGEKLWYDEETKAQLDQAHLRKIYASDAIFVINRHGYIGESTLNEIQYAVTNGKKVFALESWGKGFRVGLQPRLRGTGQRSSLRLAPASGITVGYDHLWRGRLSLGPASEPA